MTDKIREALQDMLEWFEHVDHRDGYCCCGMRMSTHESPEYCGHVPLDAGEYHAGLIMAEARATLALQPDAVLVPRDLLVRAMYAKDGRELIEANRELRALLGKDCDV